MQACNGDIFPFRRNSELSVSGYFKPEKALGNDPAEKSALTAQMSSVALRKRLKRIWGMVA